MWASSQLRDTALRPGRQLVHVQERFVSRLNASSIHAASAGGRRPAPGRPDRRLPASVVKNASIRNSPANRLRGINERAFACGCQTVAPQRGTGPASAASGDLRSRIRRSLREPAHSARPAPPPSRSCGPSARRQVTKMRDQVRRRSPSGHPCSASKAFTSPIRTMTSVLPLPARRYVCCARALAKLRSAMRISPVTGADSRGPRDSAPFTSVSSRCEKPPRRQIEHADSRASRYPRCRVR